MFFFLLRNEIGYKDIVTIKGYSVRSAHPQCLDPCNLGLHV